MIVTVPFRRRHPYLRPTGWRWRVDWTRPSECYMYIHIYIYIYRERERERDIVIVSCFVLAWGFLLRQDSANLSFHRPFQGSRGDVYSRGLRRGGSTRPRSPNCRGRILDYAMVARSRRFLSLTSVDVNEEISRNPTN